MAHRLPSSHIEIFTMQCLFYFDRSLCKMRMSIEPLLSSKKSSRIRRLNGFYNFIPIFLSVFTQTYVKPNLCSLQTHSAAIMACDMSWSPRPVTCWSKQFFISEENEGKHKEAVGLWAHRASLSTESGYSWKTEVS